MSRQNINVILLAICQALMMTANSLLITTSALVGIVLAPAAQYATVPLGLQFLAMTTVAMPASLLMKRIGRQRAFLLSSVVAIAGAIISSLAISQGDFWLFTVGVVCLGVFNGFGQFYRFAAADVALPSFKNKAISLVMAGGVVAALAGPNLAAFTRDWIADTAFLGSYISLIGVYLITFLVLLNLKMPVTRSEESQSAGRSLAEIINQPVFIVAVCSGMVSYGVMNVIMTATPLDMELNGLSFNDTAFVIQWHVLGMFAPSFFTGSLINRFGATGIIRTGIVAILICIGLNLIDTSLLVYWVALTLLGIGWNFMFIGGTTLLTNAYQAPEKAKTQGCNDLMVFSVVTVTALSSGYLHHSAGWAIINLGAFPFLLIVFALTVWYRPRLPN